MNEHVKELHFLILQRNSSSSGGATLTNQKQQLYAFEITLKIFAIKQIIVFFYSLSVFKKMFLISIGNKFCERARNCRSNGKRMGILSLTFLPTSNRKQFWEEPSLPLSFFLYLSLSFSFYLIPSLFICFLSVNIELAYNVYSLFITFYLLFI